MLIDRRTLERIEQGEVTRAYRRWKRPQVVAGTVLRTSLGLIEMVRVEAVELEDLTEADARIAGFDSVDEMLRSIRPTEPGRKLFAIDLRWAGEDPRVALRQEAELDQPEIDEILEEVGRIGRHNRPSGMELLRAIADRPATLAADLASDLGVEKQVLKRKVRQLKELGLTESLRRGYRLSPRGEAFLDASSGPG